MASLLESGLEAKVSGNGFFKEGELKKAIAEYTKAIDNFEDHRDSCFTKSTDTTPTRASPSDSNADSLSEADSNADCDMTKADEDKATEKTADIAGRSEENKEAVEEALSEDEKKLVRDIAICYSNRAFCHLKMENNGSAIVDAEQALLVDPTYPKSYYRLGSARYALGKYKDAMKAFKTLCKLAPQDKDARVKLKECEKMVQAQRFASAIASENTVPISEVCAKAVESMPVEKSYIGPVYPGRENLTHEWVVEFLQFMKGEKTIDKKSAYMIVLDIIEVLKTHSTLMNINEEEGAEFTVCGDIHGQYYDLLNIFEMNGHPSETNGYLFNGDFVDRGSFSIEVILSLFVWKLLYPNKLHLARGNHETKSMNKLYGFEGETKKKFDLQLYNLFCEAFCYLPLCHVLNDEVFIVHGGLFSKDDITLETIAKQDRRGEPADEGPIVEMLWSDPGALPGRHPSRRGVGVAFGPDVTRNFLKKNDLSMVVRSHEMKEEGYEIEHDGQLITIFSAPNYCDQMRNKGAFIRWKVGKDPSWYAEESAAIQASNKNLKNLSFKINKYSWVPHPEVRAMSYANPILGSMMGT